MSEGHMVPPAVAVAIAAGRPEMLALAPKNLPEEQVAGLYGILGDLIRNGLEQSQRIRKLERCIHNAFAQADDTVRAARMVLAESEGLRTLLRQAIGEKDDA